VRTQKGRPHILDVAVHAADFGDVRGCQQELQWADPSAGKFALPLGSSVGITYPGCGPSNLYALESTCPRYPYGLAKVAR
jgi:hypothetical protein